MTCTYDGMCGWKVEWVVGVGRVLMYQPDRFFVLSYEKPTYINILIKQP